MEDAAANLERRMEAAAGAAEISKRGIKETAEEAKVKAAVRAADSFSLAWASSVATAASTAVTCLRGVQLLLVVL